MQYIKWFCLILASALIYVLINSVLPIKAVHAEFFKNCVPVCPDDLPGGSSPGGNKAPSIKLPSLTDLPKEIAKCATGKCNLAATVQQEIKNCFSGGCDPEKIYQKFDGTSEAFGELGRVLYQAAADTMRAKHVNSKPRPLTTFQKKVLRPYFPDLVDKVSVIYNGRMMDNLGSIAGKKLSSESAAQTYGYQIYVKGSFDEQNCLQATLLAHELVHVHQFKQKSSNSLSNFGYHYFKSWAKNGFRYSKIGFEVDASKVEMDFVNKECGEGPDGDGGDASIGVDGTSDGGASSGANSNSGAVSANSAATVKTPEAEATQAINNALQAGDIAQAITIFEEAKNVSALTLPESLAKNICAQGMVKGQQAQVQSLCVQILTDGLKMAEVQTQYAGEASSFVDTLVRHLVQFKLPDLNITTQSMTDALLRPDAGLRINATVERIWADWLPYGPKTVQTDPATQNLTPFRVLIIRLIQGRQLTLTTSEQHALYNLLTRAEPTENWRDSMNGIIGAINRDSFQVVFQAGNSVIAGTQSAQPAPAEVEPVAEPQNNPPATGEPVGEPVAAEPPAGQSSLLTDFESFGAWKRGDEAWGSFKQSSEQAFGGKTAGKFTYDFPAGAENNYIVFQHTLPIAGEPTELALQVYGDGSTHFLNAWVQDAKGQLWQFTFGRIQHQGWQEMVAPLNLAIGWPNQAIDNPNVTTVAYPIRFYAFVLDGYTSEQSFSGVIFVDELVARGARE